LIKVHFSIYDGSCLRNCSGNQEPSYIEK